MPSLRRNKKIAVLGTICLLMAAGGAYAYWTQGGTGSGTAGTGTTANLTITQTSTVAGLAPGAPAQPLSGTITNPNDGTVHVASVTAALSSTGLPAGCTTADYQINDAVSTVDADVASGASANWSGPSIQMVNSATNQDACKTATVTITYTSL